MPFPQFDHNGVLPPHLGMPTDPAQLSPYPVSPVEVCARFGFSAERRGILRGWLGMRAALRQLGYASGFQWLDGSFMEDAETFRGRPPGDIDVVSFLEASQIKPGEMDAPLLGAISNHQLSKAQFQVPLVPRLHRGTPLSSQFHCARPRPAPPACAMESRGQGRDEMEFRHEEKTDGIAHFGLHSSFVIRHSSWPACPPP